jgi:hypothetical protein
VDAFLRSRGLFLAVALLSFSAACAAKGGAPVGVSDAPHGRGGGGGAIDGGLVDGAASLPSSYRSTFEKLNRARIVSRGHTDQRWEIDVWANEAAKRALVSRARGAEVGAIAVAEHYERREGSSPGPVMVMEKRAPGYAPEHGDWRYVVVGSRGQLVRDGSIEQCWGCHDDAPQDGFFAIVE